MFIPLHDANRLRHIRFQYVTVGLIVVNFIVFALTWFGTENVQVAAILGLGYIPSVAFDNAELPPEYMLVPETLTYLTYSFLHNDIWHIGGNMLFLWVFGDNVEDAMGHVRFLVFYLASAAGGALFHGLVAPVSQAPLIGASGAIAGVVTAYLMLHPRVKIWVLAFGRIPLRIPAYITLALWIAFQFVMFAMGGEEQISWACHIGGIVTGAILVLLLRRRGVPLFGRGEAAERAAEVSSPSPWGRQ